MKNEPTTDAATVKAGSAHPKQHVCDIFVGYHAEPSQADAAWLVRIGASLVRNRIIVGQGEPQDWLTAISLVNMAGHTLGWEHTQTLARIKRETGWEYYPFGGVEHQKQLTMTTNQTTTHPTAPTAGVQSGAQHTWVYDRYGVVGTDARTVCTLHGDGSAETLLTEADHRDGYLLASAPELLAALEAVAADPRMVRLRTEHQTMIRTAIAKARGNQ